MSRAFALSLVCLATPGLAWGADLEATEAPWTPALTRAEQKSTTTALIAPLATTFGTLALAGALLGIGVEDEDLGVGIVGFLIGEAGLLVGPSIGHLYTGDLRSLPFMLGRGALAGLRNIAFTSLLLSGMGCEDTCVDAQVAMGVAAGALVLEMALAVVEIALTPSSVERANEPKVDDGPFFTLAPTLLPAGAGRGHRLLPALTGSLRF